MDNIRHCVQTVLREEVPGDLIETGVWRGGAVMLMKGILNASGSLDRRVFVADSFQGLPPPDPEKYPADEGDDHHRFRNYLGVSRRQVEESFRRYGLLDDKVVFLEGWFKDTLAGAPIDKLAILRLDGDMYESTRDALHALYPKLQPGGFCIVDDYSHPACRQAVDDYFRAHGLHVAVTQIDWSGAYWRKPRP
jgi:O-methyltransferase